MSFAELRDNFKIRNNPALKKNIQILIQKRKIFLEHSLIKYIQSEMHSVQQCE